MKKILNRREAKSRRIKKCLIILTALMIFFPILTANAQTTISKPKVSENINLSKGLTVTNVVADNDKLELKVTIFNHTPNTVKAVVQAYAFPYGYYLTDTYSYNGLTIVLERLEKLVGVKLPQQDMDAIPLSQRIKPPFDFSLKSEKMAWWTNTAELEFRPNASREITYRELPARFVPNSFARTKMFYPSSEFVETKGSSLYSGRLCYAPLNLTTFNMSSFYVVVEDDFRVPKRLNSTFFLDRWAEYDKKKK